MFASTYLRVTYRTGVDPEQFVNEGRPVKAKNPPHLDLSG
jgi:hypothetical protein